MVLTAGALKPIQIGSRWVGPGYPPFILAELSANHNHVMDRAMAIIDQAAEVGVAAIKLQTYTADSITIDAHGPEFMIQEADSLWAEKNLYALYQEAAMPYDWHAPLFERARAQGLEALSTPFDKAGVDFLMQFDVPAFKIASCENVDIPLIEYTAQQGKPIIISTGMASLDEIDDAVTACRDNGCHEIILLKCVVSYPAQAKDYNLRTIPAMRQRFGVHVGLSDHTLGLGTAIAAVTLGAPLVEKHLTLSRADGGVDDAFSTEPEELRQLTQGCVAAWEAMEGQTLHEAQSDVSFELSEAELTNRKYRRSLYIVEDVKAGEVLTETNCRAIRPGLGLLPKHYKTVLGRRVTQDIAKGTPLGWGLLSES